MSDKPEAAAAPKKKGLVKKLMPLLIGAVLIGAGAGGGIYAASSGLIGGHGEKASKKKKDEPEHVKRHEEDEPKHNDPDGDGEYETSYFEIKKEFTANLLDPNRYIQVGIGVATTYDEKVTAAVEKNEPAVRSAVLGVLGEQNATTVTSIAGKEALQRRLRATINQVLEQKTGFGGISEVYFTSFVIQ